MPPNPCAACTARPAAVGLLCEECREELASPLSMVPQQILATIVKPTGDVVIDQWGRPHPLEPRTLIGRAIDGTGILILEASVSRHHAHLARDRDGAWSVRDLGSANGTTVNDRPVEAQVTLRHGDRLAFGAVGFYLATGLGELPVVDLDPASITTVRPGDLGVPGVTPPAEATTEIPGGALAEFPDREETNAGLPSVPLRLIEPSGGGGGFLELGKIRVQISVAQLELLQLLARRMTDEPDRPDLVRGFVRNSELLASLSWDTRDPDEGHVKQLVRRTRRLMVRAGLGELIESRHGFGYRLRVVPTP